jgi:hypothetical protein
VLADVDGSRGPMVQSVGSSLRGRSGKTERGRAKRVLVVEGDCEYSGWSWRD